MTEWDTSGDGSGDPFDEHGRVEIAEPIGFVDPKMSTRGTVGRLGNARDSTGLPRDALRHLGRGAEQRSSRFQAKLEAGRSWQDAQPMLDSGGTNGTT
jgi:hypothetical protein